MTLAQLRALLERAHGPAVECLREHTNGAVAEAFLPRAVCVQGDACSFPTGLAGRLRQLEAGNAEADMPLDLTDPGTVNGIRTALALARGADPAEGVIWKRWSSEEWALETSSLRQHFRIHEPDPIRALVLAVEHVLATR